MNQQQPPYVIIARKPVCGCIVLISPYWPNDPHHQDPILAKSIAGCIKAGLLITTIPFDQHPLKTEKFGCTHKTGQLALALEGEK